MEIKIEAKEQYTCLLPLLCLIEAAGKTLEALEEKISICWKGLDEEWTGAQPGLPSVFLGERAASMRSECLNICNGSELLLADPLWFHLHLGSCCRKSTADNLSRVRMCCSFPHRCFWKSALCCLISFCQKGSPGEHHLNKMYLNSNYLIMLTEKKKCSGH